MAKPVKSKAGSGCFQWNASSWLGGALGSTAWMLVVAGFLLANKQAMLALVPLAGFFAAAVAATLLWRRRHLISPFSAYMVFGCIVSVVFPMVWFVVWRGGEPRALEAMNWPMSARAMTLVALVGPALMLFALLQERMARRSQSSVDHRAG